MKKRLLLAATTLTAFLVAIYGSSNIVALLGFEPAHFSDLSFSLYRAGSWIGIPMLVLAAWYGPRWVLRELGWQASVGTGLLMALACTLPMLLGYAVPVDYQDWAGAIFGVVAGRFLGRTE